MPWDTKEHFKKSLKFFQRLFLIELPTHSTRAFSWKLWKYIPHDVMTHFWSLPTPVLKKSIPYLTSSDIKRLIFRCWNGKNIGNIGKRPCFNITISIKSSARLGQSPTVGQIFVVYNFIVNIEVDYLRRNFP